MKIDFVKLKFGDEASYKIKSADYCCVKLETNPMIGIYHEYPETDGACRSCPERDCNCKYEYSDEICPRIEAFEEPNVDEEGRYLGMMIQEIDTHPEPWEDYYTTDYWYYAIHVCPFCSEKIEVVVSEEIDATEKFEQLRKLREELWNKCRKTDSKKKEAELRKEVEKLDGEIEDFYRISEFQREKYIL